MMSENSQVLIRGDSKNKNEEDFDLNLIEEKKANNGSLYINKRSSNKFQLNLSINAPTNTFSCQNHFISKGTQMGISSFQHQGK